MVYCFFNILQKYINKHISDYDLTCNGKTFKNVTLTAYYPDYIDSDQEYGYEDKRGKKLKTLQV